MGNFEKLGILVIIILVVVILVLAVWGMGVPPNDLVQTDPGTPLSSNAKAPASAPAKEPSKTVDLEKRTTEEKAADDWWTQRFGPDLKETEKTEPAPVVRKEAPAEPAPTLEDLHHRIAKGDNFYKLSGKYYGSTKYFKVIADANPGKDPGALQIGDEIVIPHPDKVLKRSASKAAAKSETPTHRARTYTAKEGDTLSRVAERLLGSSRRWQEILRANEALLSGDPRNLRPGMVLTIP